MNDIISVILAAGKGTRMKSKVPKVIHKACGKYLAKWVLDAAVGAGIKKNILVLGEEGLEVKQYFEDDAKIVQQVERLGTGHAVMMAKAFLKDNINSSTVVLCGDAPLITSDILKDAFDYHTKENNDVTVIAAELDQPYGYGRIIRGNENEFVSIIEQKDANDQERQVKEISSGIFCFNTAKLLDSLDRIKNNNAQKEYYLPDALKIIKEDDGKVGVYNSEDSDIVLGVNDRVQLENITKVLRKRINTKHMINGVTFLNSENTYIDEEVIIGQDTVIYPGCILEGTTTIGEECVIGSNTRIQNSSIGNGTNVNSSVVCDSSIGENTNVGPFAYIRPGSNIGNEVKVGDFVEVKKSKIGNGSKVSHLAYIGDAEIGNNVNMGCGSITVNYDGKNKFKTIVEDNAFIGSNVNLISPVTIKTNAFVAAGSTITDEVPEYSLAIARNRQIVKEEWVKNKKKREVEK